jgi:hypothetical protein
MFAARLMGTETGEALVKPEFTLVELLFFKSEHEKSDAEAVARLGERRRHFYSFSRRSFCRSPLAVDPK